MPSTYAHYRMGQEVRGQVWGLAKEAIEAYPELYLIGLHGPDILFYYKPLFGGEINKEGSRMHRRSGEEFFRHAAEVIRGCMHRSEEDSQGGNGSDGGVDKSPGSESDGEADKPLGSESDGGVDKPCVNESDGGVDKSCGNESDGSVDKSHGNESDGSGNTNRYDLSHLSYAYGFICHFALDVTCHGYIGKKIEESGISHTEIESEFDRELLVMDGFDPVRKRLTDHLVPSTENGRVIADFYFDPIRPEDAAKAVKGMIFYSNIFLSPSHAKRAFVNAALKVSGNYDGLHGMMINYEKNPNCDDSCKKLLELYGQARNLAVRLIMEYEAYLDGMQELDKVYQYNFESEIPRQ